MGYPSLLFTERASGRAVDPGVFEDVKLNLLFSDEAISAMRVLCRREDICVRQELFKALLNENGNTLALFKALAAAAEDIRRLDEALGNERCDNERNFLYVNLLRYVVRFYRLASKVTESSGLLGRFASWFENETEGEAFKAIEKRCGELEEASRAVRTLTMRMAGDNLWLRLEDPQTLIGRLKAASRDLGLRDLKAERETDIALGPRLINASARLRPAEFAAFKAFYEDFSDFYDRSILSYRYELNFYIETTELLLRLKRHNIPVCWPKVSEERKIYLKNARDISLLAKNETNIVPNDVLFTESEPFFFLTGANGGGKTTYLRCAAISTLFFLAGCPVAAEHAVLWPVDCVFTHFPRDERFEGDGRFADERRRVEEIMKAHGGNSLVLLNETYSTTNEELALKCTSELAEALHSSGCFGLYITHQHKLAGDKIPFLSVIVDESDANRRTFRIARLRASSGSYAEDILKKYGLTREALIKRFSEKKAGQ